MARTILERHVHPKYPRLQVQLRQVSKFYQAWTSLDGKKLTHSTKTTQLSTAFKLAEEWYWKLLRANDEKPINKLGTDPTMGELYSPYKSGLDKQRRTFAEWRWGPIQHFWRTIVVSDITTKTFKDYYAWRRQHTRGIKSHTLHKDVVLIRQLMKHAIEEGHITSIPLVPKVGKIVANPRPWLTVKEWKKLVKVGEDRIEKADNKRTRQQRQDALDLAMLIVNTMCRVGEILSLTFGDCQLIKNTSGEFTLRAHVKGKRGHRTVIAPREAMVIIARRFEAAGKDNAKLVFEEHHRDAFRELLDAADLRVDNDGSQRNYKSLRATGISFRVLQGMELLTIARAAGTSVAMIDQFYAKRLTSELHVDALSQPLTAIRP